MKNYAKIARDLGLKAGDVVQYLHSTKPGRARKKNPRIFMINYIGEEKVIGKILLPDRKWGTETIMYLPDDAKLIKVDPSLLDFTTIFSCRKCGRMFETKERDTPKVCPFCKSSRLQKRDEYKFESDDVPKEQLVSTPIAKSLTLVQEDQICELRSTKNMTMEKLATLFKTSTSTIHKVLKAHKLDARSMRG